jgi:hypothetical protein
MADVLEAVAEEVKSEATKVAEEVKTEMERVEQKLTAEESLFLRELELEFLKVQMGLKDLQRKAEAANQKYVAKLEELMAKYGIDKTKMNFDNVTNSFRANPKPAQAMAVAQKN